MFLLIAFVTLVYTDVEKEVDRLTTIITDVDQSIIDLTPKTPKKFISILNQAIRSRNIAVKAIEKIKPGEDKEAQKYLLIANKHLTKSIELLLELRDKIEYPTDM